MSFFSRVVNIIKSFQFVKNPHRALSDKVEIVEKVEKEKINVIFESRIISHGKINQTLLNVVTANNLQLPVPKFGVCQGGLQCKTCHVIFSEEDYNRIKPPSAEELRALGTGKARCNTSRFACQVPLSPDMDGIVVRLPQVVRKRKF